MFPKAGVCRAKTVALQNARPRCRDHEELLDSGGHVASGTKVEEADVPALAATLLPWPVLPWVGFVAGRLHIITINSCAFLVIISFIIIVVVVVIFFIIAT